MKLSSEALGYMCVGADHRPLAIERIAGTVVARVAVVEVVGGVEVAGGVEAAPMMRAFDVSTATQNDDVGHERPTITAVGRSTPCGADQTVPSHVETWPVMRVATQNDGDGQERFVAPARTKDVSGDHELPFQVSALPAGSSAAHHVSEAHESIGLVPEFGEPTWVGADHVPPCHTDTSPPSEIAAQIDGDGQSTSDTIPPGGGGSSWELQDSPFHCAVPFPSTSRQNDGDAHASAPLTIVCAGPLKGDDHLVPSNVSNVSAPDWTMQNFDVEQETSGSNVVSVPGWLCFAKCTGRAQDVPFHTIAFP